MDCCKKQLLAHGKKCYPTKNGNNCTPFPAWLQLTFQRQIENRREIMLADCSVSVRLCKGDCLQISCINQLPLLKLAVFKSSPKSRKKETGTKARSVRTLKGEVVISSARTWGSFIHISFALELIINAWVFCFVLLSGLVTMKLCFLLYLSPLKVT